MVKKVLRCPECHGDKLVKFGTKFARLSLDNRKRHQIQQYQCKDCGRITVKPVENE